jgi:hypothetical protein
VKRSEGRRREEADDSQVKGSHIHRWSEPCPHGNGRFAWPGHQKPLGRKDLQQSPLLAEALLRPLPGGSNFQKYGDHALGLSNRRGERWLGLYSATPRRVSSAWPDLGSSLCSRQCRPVAHPCTAARQ